MTPRRHDPDRRARIVDAAVAVLGRGGIAALSHRAVAAEADVPLGSTTYHFSSLDDLLLAALRRIDAAWLAGIARWSDGVRPGVPLADELTGLVGELLGRGRDVLQAEYELYLAGLRREPLRQLATECLDAMAALLRRHTADEATARTLVALLDGLILRCLLTSGPYDRDEIRAAFARVTGESPSAHAGPDGTGPGSPGSGGG
ncbi:TetR family transcriptional regulator [Streptomyces sp. B1866]|uniref:TetR/AcrR family transcriptional regulator n=1 Tax=Streptomyces sp. B1866 TaxID=3075431 RepID=UPI0028917A33|nr:TetR family transcriptional regulator [Streptomyces sp. B1866]MDT3396079.1 TetR family transcriptional regulator [Streptomyces sp. B1866]